jgi:hypothetical protein
MEMPRVETVAAANFKHLAARLQDHPREDTPLDPETVIFRRELPVLIQVVVEPFRARMESPLQCKLHEMSERRDLSNDEIYTFH